MAEPLEWDWSDRARRRAIFRVGRIPYALTISRTRKGSFEVEFDTDPAAYAHYNGGGHLDTPMWGLTGTGNALSVMATVVEIVKEFVRDQQPQSIEWIAFEPSRQRLYSSLLRRSAGTLMGAGFGGYEVSEAKSADCMTFKLTLVSYADAPTIGHSPATRARQISRARRLSPCPTP